MKDIEDKLAAFLMEYGVLKNADADKMARKIAGMFEKEGELGDLKEVLKAEQEHRLAVESVRDALQSERDQLAAKCAELASDISAQDQTIYKQSSKLAELMSTINEAWNALDNGRRKHHIDPLNGGCILGCQACAVDKLKYALSSDCGKGWLSPEKAERLRKALEVCITALGSSLSDKRWEVRRIAKQALDETK